MISLTAITLSGSAIYIALQVCDRVRGIKKKNLSAILQGSTVMEESVDDTHGPISLAKQYQVAGVALDRTTAIVVLSATTGIIHIALARPLMVLNGVGTMALLIPHYFAPRLDTYRSHTRDILISYTAVTIAGFYVVKNVADWFTAVGISCKVVEFALLALLLDERKDHTSLLEKLTATAPLDKPVQTITIPVTNSGD